MMWKLEEFISLQTKIMEQHMKAQVPLEHNPVHNHQARGFLWFVSAQFSCDSALEFRQQDTAFSFLEMSNTYFTFHKNNTKKEKLHIRFRQQTVPCSLSNVLLLHIKKSVIFLLTKF